MTKGTYIILQELLVETKLGGENACCASVCVWCKMRKVFLRLSQLLCHPILLGNLFELVLWCLTVFRHGKRQSQHKLNCLVQLRYLAVGMKDSSCQFVAISTIVRMCVLKSESSLVTSLWMQTVQDPSQSMCTFSNEQRFQKHLTILILSCGLWCWQASQNLIGSSTCLHILFHLKVCGLCKGIKSSRDSRMVKAGMVPFNYYSLMAPIPSLWSCTLLYHLK